LPRLDPAVNVALLFFRDGALEPRTRGTEFPVAGQTAAHLVQTSAKALVIDTALHVAFLFFRNGTLEPRTRGGELPGGRQAVAHVVQT
jgi:hypothetical protein